MLCLGVDGEGLAAQLHGDFQGFVGAADELVHRYWRMLQAGSPSIHLGHF